MLTVSNWRAEQSYTGVLLTSPIKVPELAHSSPVDPRLGNSVAQVKNNHKA